jgi:hypothetical protein
MKWSGQRPVCQYWSRSNIECSWEITDDFTWVADLKTKVAEAANRVDYLDILVSAMKFDMDKSSTKLLAQTRLGVGVEALAQSIRFGYHTAPVNVVGLCNDLQGHSLHMHEGRLALALPRRRAYTGHVIMRDKHEKSETCEPRTSLQYRTCRAHSRVSLVYRIAGVPSFIGASCST